MVFEHNGVKLHYEEAGQGAAVLFLHGLAANLDTWQDQAGRLEDRFRTLRVDLRGHGLSSTPPGSWTIADMARDLTALLDHLGIERVHVVGHSGGGVVAVRMLLDRPDLIASLCLVATAAECNEKAATEFYHRWADLAESEGMSAVLRAMGSKRDVDESKLGDPSGFARASRAIATLYPEPLTPRLAGVKCPALIVVGDKDWIGAGGAVKLSRVLDGSELVILPGQGHLPFLQEPDGFAARLSAFLGRVGA